MKNRRKYKVNRVTDIVPVENNVIEPEIIEPGTDVTEMPYQAFEDKQTLYTQLKQSCNAFDGIIEEIVKRKFSKQTIEDMTVDQALKVFDSLENAKNNRSRFFLEYSAKLSNDDFFQRQLELEQGKLLMKYLKDNAKKEEKPTNETKPKGDDLIKQKMIRLLQEAVEGNIARKKEDDNNI